VDIDFQNTTYKEGCALVARVRTEKQAEAPGTAESQIPSYLRWILGFGGLGGIAGLLSSRSQDERTRKRPLSRAVTGAILGALGGGLGRAAIGPAKEVFGIKSSPDAKGGPAAPQTPETARRLGVQFSRGETPGGAGALNVELLPATSPEETTGPLSKAIADYRATVTKPSPVGWFDYPKSTGVTGLVGFAAPQYGFAKYVPWWGTQQAGKVFSEWIKLPKTDPRHLLAQNVRNIRFAGQGTGNPVVVPSRLDPGGLPQTDVGPMKGTATPKTRRVQLKSRMVPTPTGTAAPTPATKPSIKGRPSNWLRSLGYTLGLAQSSTVPPNPDVPYAKPVPADFDPSSLEGTRQRLYGGTNRLGRAWRAFTGRSPAAIGASTAPFLTEGEIDANRIWSEVAAKKPGIPARAGSAALFAAAIPAIMSAAKSRAINIPGLIDALSAGGTKQEAFAEILDITEKQVAAYTAKQTPIQEIAIRVWDSLIGPAGFTPQEAAPFFYKAMVDKSDQGPETVENLLKGRLTDNDISGALQQEIVKAARTPPDIKIPSMKDSLINTWWNPAWGR